MNRNSIPPILLVSLMEAFGLEPNEDYDGWYIKGSTKIANGEFVSYHHSFGFFKTDKISAVGLFENGILVKLSTYDKKGNITNEWTK